MAVPRLPLLAASGAAISAVCLTLMAVTAVSMGYFGPDTAAVAPADLVSAPTHPVVTTPPLAVPSR